MPITRRALLRYAPVACGALPHTAMTAPPGSVFARALPHLPASFHQSPINLVLIAKEAS
jgi:hypothetical protein